MLALVVGHQVTPMTSTHVGCKPGHNAPLEIAMVTSNPRPVQQTLTTTPKTTPASTVQQLSSEAMALEIARLKAENAALSEKVQKKAPAFSAKVTGKGAVSFYGLGRFPVSLYREQWAALADNLPSILAFIDAHKGSLKGKDEDEASFAKRTATDPVLIEARRRAAESEAKRNG